MPFNRPIPQSKPRAKSPSALATLVEAEKLMQIAILLPSSAFIGWLAGAWLDSRLHQEWIAVAGIIFGGVAGLVYVIRLVLAAGVKTAGGRNANGAEPGKGGSEDEP
ncbi:MAG: AtpZ/AtpI family protein [Terracidiphilus sp.]